MTDFIFFKDHQMLDIYDAVLEIQEDGIWNWKLLNPSGEGGRR